MGIVMCTKFVGSGSVFLAGIALLAGCAINSDYQRPDVTLPNQWHSDAAALAGESTSASWWRGFQNPELSRLVTIALDNNHDLSAASSRIAQARALVQIAGANLAPSLEANADITRDKSGDAKGSNSGSTKKSIGVALSFDADIWGKNRQSQAASTSRLQSSVHAQRAVALTLQADVATTYFQLLSASDRLALAQKNLSNTEAVLRLVKIQHQAGAVSGLEVARQQSLVASVKTTIAPLMQQRQQALDALAVLLGRYPQDLSVAIKPLDSVRLPQVAADLPSKLIERRPDILKAESELAAAHADINAARAALFPSIKLTAAGGGESASLVTLLRPANVAYTLAASLTAPIFDGGRLRGQVTLSKARKEELVHLYQQSILSALREVEDSLNAVRSLAEQAAEQKAVVTHATTALRLAELRYRNGAFDFASVLDAQRVLLAAQTAQETLTFSRYAATINLYRALGGGWAGGENVTPLAASAPKPAPKFAAKLTAKLTTKKTY
jgi:outer membrane protein, multidrug efflux system